MPFNGLRHSIAGEIDWKAMRKALTEMSMRAHLPEYPDKLIKKIKLGSALYFSCCDGFVIIELKKASEKTVCLVSAAYSKSGFAMQKYSLQINQIAKIIGCEYLEFWTCRTGFERLAPQFDFEKQKTVRLDNGVQFTVWRKDCGR